MRPCFSLAGFTQELFALDWICLFGSFSKAFGFMGQAGFERFCVLHSTAFHCYPPG